MILRLAKLIPSNCIFPNTENTSNTKNKQPPNVYYIRNIPNRTIKKASTTQQKTSKCLLNMINIFQNGIYFLTM